MTDETNREEARAAAARGAEEVGAATSEVTAGAGAGAEPPKKKRRGRAVAVVVGVVAVVLVAAGAGFMVWHQQPSFCNAICHSPMDPYVESYYSDDESLMVAVHREDGQVCLDCHETTLEGQINEATAWLSGDFDDPMKVRRLGTTEFCFRCHDDGNPDNGMDWAEIQASTEGFQGTSRNPHDSHQGMLDCYSCHFMHGKSTLYCQKCHSDVTVPDSWK